MVGRAGASLTAATWETRGRPLDLKLGTRHGYHYHSIPSCLTAGESDRAHSGIVGWAFDGFPIAGPRGAHGRPLTNADLDVCHGHTHRLRVDGKLVRTYHYHATLEFPYTAGCFRGAR
jgi:hypothetical protein